MLKKLGPYIVLFFISLGLAYYASLPDLEKSKGDLRWLDLADVKITEVRFSGKDMDLHISQKGRGYWAEISKDKEGKAPTTQSSPVYGFKVNSRFQDLLGYFKPLLVKRLIGTIPKEKRGTFGLLEEGHSLEILTPNKTYRFLLGDRSYGSSNMYVMDQESNEVLLVISKPFDDLSKASSLLFERDLFDEALDNIEKIEIKRGEATVTWDHTEKDQKGMLIWRDDQPDAEANSAYKSWIEKVDKLKVVRFATPQEHASLGNEKILFSVTLLREGKQVETLTFRKTGTEDKTKESQLDYWVSSNFLGWHGKLSNNRFESLDKDLPQLMGLN